MDCERYRESITDAALGGLAPRREGQLRAHLAGCAACRAALQEQRQLAAAIERGIEASFAAEPSAGFVARVRSRLAEESFARRSWFGAWAPVAAGALAVLALAAVWFARHEPARPARVESARDLASRPSAQGQAASSESAPSMPVQLRPSERRRPRHRVGGVLRDTGILPKAAEPEVLVPPGQREALVALYRAIWSNRVDGSSLVREPGPLEPAELKIPPLEIAAFDAAINPLESVNNR